MTRAFGIAFLGQPREPGLKVSSTDAPATMLVPMVVHAAGAVAVGLWPAAALALVRGALAPFPFASAVDGVLTPLEPALWGVRALAVVLAVAGTWAWWAGRNARRAPTWGCGYPAGNPRMQYTGSSFSEQFARVFDALLPVLRKEKLPEGHYPTHASHLATHHADPVERRMYEVLGQGEEYVAQVTEKIPEQPQYVFAFGLLALLAIGLFVFGVTR
jgi:hydrogenase-4 component B